MGSARQRPWFWKLTASLAGVLVVALVCELSHRAWLALRHGAYDAAVTEAELRALLDPMAQFVPGGGAPRGAEVDLERAVLHPYYGSERRPDPGGVLQWFEAHPAPREEYVVLVVGGSVAAGWADDLQRGLSQGERSLPAAEGRPVHVLNAAHAAYKQPQPLMRVAYLFSFGHRPDLVLALDGFNEVALSAQNAIGDLHPLHPPYPVWGVLVESMRAMDPGRFETLSRIAAVQREADELVDGLVQRGLLRSSLVGHYAKGRLRRLRARAVRLQEALVSPQRGERDARQVGGPPFTGTVEEAVVLGAGGWFESSLSLDALCRRRGVAFVHVLQPTLLDEGAKPFSPEEEALGSIPRGWLEGATLGYPMLRARGAELRAAGVRFLDASRAFSAVRGTLYLDHCHFGEAGNRLLTEFVLADLAGS